MQILILHAGALGDCVLGIHVIDAIVRAWNVSSVTMVARSPIARWARRHGLPSEVLSFEHQEVLGLYSQDRSLSGETACFLRRFDRVISFLGGPKDEVSRRLSTLQGLEVLAIDPRPRDTAMRNGVHIAQQWLDQLAGYGYRVPLSAAKIDLPAGARRTHCETLAKRLGAKPGHVLLCHPGSGGLRKCCAVEALERLVEKLGSLGWCVGWIVGPDEVERSGSRYVERLQGSAPVIYEESVQAAADVVSGAGGYLGHDAGMTHVAAFVGVPTIALFGPTDPRVWRPLGASCRIGGFPPEDGPLDAWIDKIVAQIDGPDGSQWAKSARST